MKKWLRADSFFFLVIFSLFFMPVIPQRMYLSITASACGASEGGIMGGEIMRAHTGCEEFRDSHSVGVGGWFLLFIPFTLVLWRFKRQAPDNGGHALRWPLTHNPNKKVWDGCDHTSAAFWQLCTAQHCAEKLQSREPLSTELQPKSHCLPLSVCLAAT